MPFHPTFIQLFLTIFVEILQQFYRYKHNPMSALHVIKTLLSEEHVAPKRFLAALMVDCIFNNDYKELRTDTTQGTKSLNKGALEIMKCNIGNQNDMKRLRKYSFEGLIEKIENEWLCGKNHIDYLENKPLLYDLPDTNEGFVSFEPSREKATQWDNRLKPNKYPYGELLYEPSQYDSTIQVQTEEKNIAPANKSAIPTHRDKIINDINSFYTKLTNAQDRQGKKLDYAWQWKITKEEYDELKDFLTDIGKNSRQLNALIATCKYAKLVGLYVAEWYKRDYSDNGDEQVLDQIGLTGKAKMIANACFGENSPRIYKGESNTSWLYSLYVDGGLPLNYLRDDLEELIRQALDNNLDFDDIAAGKFKGRSIALQQSYEDKASIYEYLEAIVGKDYPVADEDLIERINSCAESARRKQEQIRISYQAWKFKYGDFDEFYIKSVLNITNDGELLADYLKSKGVKTDNLNAFHLHVKLNDNDNKKVLQSIRFSKCRNGNYIARGGNSSFGLEILHRDTFDGFKSYSLELNDCYSDSLWSFDCGHKATGQQYLQLFSHNGNEWYDNKRGKDRTLFSAAIIPYDWEIKEGIDYETLKNHKWFTFHEKVIVIPSKGKEISLVNTDCKDIYVYPKDQHRIVKHKYIKDIRAKDEDGIDERVFLISTDEIEFVKIKQGKGEREITSIEYQCKKGEKYLPYSKDVKLSGLVKFRIDDDYTLKCFVLPSDADITRHCEPDKGNIQFKNLGCFSIWQGDTIVGDCTYSDSYSSNKAEEYCSFRIGTEDRCIELKVARPFHRNVRIFDGDIIEDNTDKSVPARFADRCNIRRFDSNGVRNISAANKWELNAKVIQALAKHDYHVNAKPIYIRDKRDKQDKQDNAVISYKIFTRELDKDYCIDKGKEVYNKDLKFVYLSLKDNSVQELETYEEQDNSRNDIKYLKLRLPKNRESDGLIMQSLKNGMKPSEYYAVKYVPESEHINKEQPSTNDKKDIRNSRLQDYISDNDLFAENAFHHFEIAAEHGMYFGAMDVLLSMITPRDRELNTNKNIRDCIKRLAKFYIGYCDYCRNKDKRCDFEALWRLADEFIFDWMLLPRSVWEECTGNDSQKKKSVEMLFGQRPDMHGSELAQLGQFVKSYWTFGYKPKGGRQPEDVKFLRYILSDGSSDLKIGKDWKTLKSFNETQDLFYKINEKIGNW